MQVLWPIAVPISLRTIVDDVQKRFGWLTVIRLFSSVMFVAASAATSAQAQTSKPIRVTVVDRVGYDKVIAANIGKIVVVDCWATWCVPCRNGFPKMVELSKKYADEDVVVVSLCFDDLVKGEAPAKVTKFLEEKDARFEHLISSLNISKGGAQAFEIPDELLPHCKIYGKDGKILKALESVNGDEIKHEDIEAAVKAAIKAQTK
jgi:thiol-disulfide isomerase/thioredoxin